MYFNPYLKGSPSKDEDFLSPGTFVLPMRVETFWWFFSFTDVLSTKIWIEAINLSVEQIPTESTRYKEEAYLTISFKVC